jgi:mitochondrial chaperone BCS1
MDLMTTLYVAVISYIVFVLKEIPQRLLEILLNIISFSFSTSSKDTSSYYAINNWLLNLNKRSINNHLNAKKEYSKSGVVTNFSINYGQFYLSYKKNLILIKKELIQNTFDVSDKITIRVLGFNKEKVKNEILNAINKNNKVDMITVHPLPDIWDNYSTNRKSFDDVFIKNKDEIIDHLNNWITLKPIYEKHGITYKTGILLYGSPGTGKTTTAKAIASYLGFNLHIVNLKSYKEEQSLIRKIINIPEKSVILFEDIDCLLGNRKEELESETKALLGTVLNILDGILSPENVVFVATTNYIDALDNALIRDGRFDLKINVDLIDKELAIQMCQRYGVDENNLLNDEIFPINPSYLQNKILKSLRAIH